MLRCGSLDRTHARTQLTAHISCANTAFETNKCFGTCLINRPAASHLFSAAPGFRVRCVRYAICGICPRPTRRVRFVVGVPIDWSAGTAPNSSHRQRTREHAGHSRHASIHSTTTTCVMRSKCAVHRLFPPRGPVLDNLHNMCGEHIQERTAVALSPSRPARNAASDTYVCERSR